MNKPCLCIIINGHEPFVSFSGAAVLSPEEQNFFEAVSETYIPLLELFGRLENSGVPFRLGMVLSPSLCAMFQDKRLMEKYLAWLDKRIDFGRHELDRSGSDAELSSLSRFYFNQDIERRISLTERYGMDLLGAFAGFQKKGRVEFLGTAATAAFLPFYASMSEAVHAQIETALIHHRRYLGRAPSGFWLPDLGWTAALGQDLMEYHFSYTVVDSHALILGRPPARAGIFNPVKTPSGLTVFARDITALTDLKELIKVRPGIYQMHFLDAGYELSLEALKPLLGPGDCRCSTGYRYWQEDGKKKTLYKPQEARELACEQARDFLALRLSRLEEARRHLENEAVSVWVIDAAGLGHGWYEGPFFLEALIHEIALRGTVDILSPQDYLDQGSDLPFQISEPEYSSSLRDGYGGMLLDASNDWIYRHIFRSIQRMIEMTERFPADTGLKERALNQAAREILLAQSTDWSKPLNPQGDEKTTREYAEKELEGALRNFTTIYEALGSNHISTEWLAALEKRHALFPYINYRVFGKKK
ncbi:MAG: DUF1957 domain-containing protein [Spirochaetaceae bacterium]|jgi:1,4-alpha-glucan branching enzyme|nr:DUF1957 domain-containing protein [Spirochaetaceae bacterium]